ncbi:hypothetical protein BKA66DRAFT_452242, partial [Pyrenochaeta sp. MPI-SDFR-AT-0127]
MRIVQGFLYEEVRAIESYYSKMHSNAENAMLAKNVKKFTFDCRRYAWQRIHSGQRTTSISIPGHVGKPALENIKNVRELRIVEWSNPKYSSPCRTPKPTDWLSIINNAVPGSRNEFAFLKHLAIYSAYVSVQDLLPVFRIPSLLKLTLHGAYQPFPLENWTIPQSSCNLKELHLLDCFINSPALAQVLLIMRGLKKLDYQYSTRNWEPLGPIDKPKTYWAYHTWNVVGDALRTQKQSLQFISLEDFSDQELIKIVYPQGRDIGKLGSFKDFPKLQSLKAPIDAILDLDAGEDNLAVYLPSHLSEFKTKLSPKDTVAPLCTSIIWSIHHVLGSGSNKVLGLSFERDFPFRQCRLSRLLHDLTRAGIDVRPSWYRKTGPELEFLLATIRWMESAEYNVDLGDELDDDYIAYDDADDLFERYWFAGLSNFRD